MPSESKNMTYFTLIRSDRKTLSLRITEAGILEIRAPYGLPQHEIDKFLTSKQAWINKHLERRKSLTAKKVDFTTDYGDSVTLCGKEYPIQARAGNKAGFDEICFYVPPNLPKESIRLAVIQIYKLLAKRIFIHKTNIFSKHMNVNPASVKINSAKTRWGSCSGRNSINFSWRLVMADDEVIDYVVVHELAHIKEHNHSRRFWAEVAAIIPDYGQRRDALKLLQDRLCEENWD